MYMTKNTIIAGLIVLFVILFGYVLIKNTPKNDAIKIQENGSVVQNENVGGESLKSYSVEVNYASLSDLYLNEYQININSSTNAKYQIPVFLYGDKQKFAKTNFNFFSNIDITANNIKYIAIIDIPQDKAVYRIPGGGDEGFAIYDPALRKWFSVDDKNIPLVIKSPGKTDQGYVYHVTGMSDAQWGLNRYLIEIPSKNKWFVIDFDTSFNEGEYSCEYMPSSDLCNDYKDYKKNTFIDSESQLKIINSIIFR
jgi:hypothetical protein